MHRRRRLVLGLSAVLALLVGLTFTPDRATSADGSEQFTPNACADGRIDLVLESFDTTPAPSFVVFKADPSIPDPALAIVRGCSGQALSFGYDLTGESSGGQSWIVLQKSFPPMDLSGYTHLRVALRGSNLNSHHGVEIKLWDGARLYPILLRSMTDLPVWRPIYIDLRELRNNGTPNLQTISRFEIAVVRCTDPVCEVADNPGSPQPPNQPAGTLFVDEFALIDLKPGAPQRVVQTTTESVPLNRPVAARAAAAIYRQVSAEQPTAGLVPAWFPEQSPNYNTYAQAEALLVFTYEYIWTGDIAYRDAARGLARKLLSLQIPAGRSNAGAWYTAYDRELQPPFRPPAEGGGQQRCNGDETAEHDIDACMWVGNVGWALIGLGTLQRYGIYDEPAALDAAIKRGADWLVGQIGRRPEHPALLGPGTEGNISAYFGLLAAGRRAEAAQLGEAIVAAAWDDTQRRIRPGAGGGSGDFATALDVSGSWGATFLRTTGRAQEALDSQGYSVSVLRASSFDGTVVGYGDIAGPYTVPLEFAAQAVVAGVKDARFVIGELYPLQLADGSFPGAPDHWYGGALTPWSTTMPGVSPTAWIYFAATGLDPLWHTFRDRQYRPFKVYLPLVSKA